MQRQTHGLALASMSERHKLRLGNRWPVINSRQMIYGLRAGVLTILLGTSSVLVSVQTQTPESTNAGRSQSQAPLRVGGKVSAPRVKWDPEPEYFPWRSVSATSGVCVLWLLLIRTESHETSKWLARSARGWTRKRSKQFNVAIRTRHERWQTGCRPDQR